MDPGVLDEVLSTGAKLKIENALSIRPRTLAELGAITGITVQGVLKHLKQLAELGLVEEKRLPTRTLKARTVYAPAEELIGNYSTLDLVIVKPTRRLPAGAQGAAKSPNLEERAAEVLLLHHRVKDQARKLGRMIDDLADEREALRAGLEGLGVSPEERLILEVLLTEETFQDGLHVLSKWYGIEERRSRAVAERLRLFR